MEKPKETTILANDAAGGGEAKKKKKRNRKKKAKNKGGGDAISTASSEDAPQPAEPAPLGASATAATMNPHAILRDRIMTEGFSARRVDRAMEEMWDKNLAYDEFEAVLKYLKGETEEKKEAAKGKTDKIFSTPKETVETDTSAGGGAEESKEPEPEKPPVPKSNLKTAPPMTMEQKLEMVANFENMTDAIFALTEWISKAAKPRDLEDLCATKRTMALVTIFRRSITEPKDRSHFENSVLPSMVRLMDSLLGKSGISSKAATETQETFEPLLKKAWSVYLLQQPDAKDFAERVSRFIVSRISLAIGESNTATTSNGKVAPQVPPSLSSYNRGKAGDKGIAELLSKREINMTAAKRYGVLARTACANVTSKGGTSTMLNGGPRETEIMTADIMLALVGDDAKTAYELQKADLEELKSQAKQQESETAQELRETIEEVNEERQTVQQRIVELRQSIEKLESYDAELCVKVVDAQSELDEEIAQSSVEAASLNEKIKESAESIKYGDSILGLVDLLKDYDDSLDKAIIAPSKATPISDIDSAENAYRQMETYLSRVRGYFQCEAETVDYLRNRIEMSKQAVGELKIEIIECEGLGMNTTIGQMNEAVKTKESLIEKDSTMMVRFTAEAASVFEGLIGRLTEYTTAQSSAVKLGAMQTDILKDIHSSSSCLGVLSMDRLDPFMTHMNGSGNAVAPLGNSFVDSSLVSQPGTATSNAKTVVEKPPTMPKFSWAAVKAPSDDSGTKTSLLDIQKEELHSKGAE